LYALAQFHEFHGIPLEGYVLISRGVPFRDLDRPPLLVHGDEDDHAVRRRGAELVFRVVHLAAEVDVGRLRQKPLSAVPTPFRPARGVRLAR
jgi:hypothetical protein